MANPARARALLCTLLLEQPVWAANMLAQRMGVSGQNISTLLRGLVAQGALVELAPGHKGVRRVQVANPAPLHAHIATTTARLATTRANRAALPKRPYRTPPQLAQLYSSAPTPGAARWLPLFAAWGIGYVCPLPWAGRVVRHVRSG